MATAQPANGMTSKAVVSVTIFRVPMMGGRIIHSRRSPPPESPGMAAIQ